MNFNREDYRGDPSIGLFTNSTESYKIGPKGIGDSSFKGRICGTRFFGMLTAGNSKGLLVPETSKQHEKESLQTTLEETKVEELESSETAIGNLVACNENGAYISPRLKHKKTKIENVLGAEAKIGKIAGCPTPGSLVAANNRGAVIHRDASESEAEKLKQALQLKEVSLGTVNTGSPFVGSGSAVSNTEITLGSDTTGPELSVFDRTLSLKD